MRPFKPPALLNRPPTAQGPPLPPPAKKRRITKDEDDLDVDVEAAIAAANLLKKPVPPKNFVAPARRPLNLVSNFGGSMQSKPEHVEERYYNVLWRKFTMKKNKTWNGDGVLIVIGTYATLKDDDGKEIGKGVCKGPLLIGSELSIGGKTIEVDSMIPKEEYISGSMFLGSSKKVHSQEEDEVPRKARKGKARNDDLKENEEKPQPPAVMPNPASKPAFKTPVPQSTVQAQQKNTTIPIPRHDPYAPGALVMKRPKKAPKGRQLVDVVVDPLLTKHLREHQREGVAFLYECVMDMKDYDGEGAILADEMGLGKTLQTITLLWTLLKQNPVYGLSSIIKKALIVCPVSLINNWRKEIRKWLGNERIGIFIPENKKTRLTDFTRGQQYQVMIIGYERLTKVKDELQGDCGIDIVIADEGHRLKTAKNKAAAAIKSLSTERRIILSGTPIQNDLEEFYQMVDFVNPSIMSKYSTFKREFETPIVKSQQPGASEKDVEKGESRSAQLAELTGKFILRRTAEILSKYLPPKTEYVVFCKPTVAQATVYRTIVGSQAFVTAMNSSAAVLELINVLKKVCNCPALLIKADSNGDETTKAEFLEGVPRKVLADRGVSGKLQVLDELLHTIKPTGEKVVLVSNYTSTMDILANLLISLDYSFLRLDGSVQQSKRQDMVDRFNRSPQSNSFIFLLSAKAGGVGLNLIGASRLILYDLDWNPATDLQAMARVHRDGQKRPCYIYRFITQGAIDEKIFQRQVSKMGLADNIVDGKSSASGFTHDELRDLFKFHESDNCQTHELLGCDCGGSGALIAKPRALAKATMASSGVFDDDGVEILDLDGDDEDLNLSSTVLEADFAAKLMSDADCEAREAEFKKAARECRNTAGKAKMLSLMQYTHFDTSRVNEIVGTDDSEDGVPDGDMDVSALGLVDSAIEDEALRKVLRNGERRIGFVFTKMST